MVPAVRALGQLRLAEDHGAGAFEPVHHGRRVIGLAIGHHSRPARRADTLDRAQVLYGDRNPVERSAVLASSDLHLGPPGGFQSGLWEHGRERVQLRLDTLDPIQRSLRRLDRRELARPQQARELAQRQCMDLWFCHAQSLQPGLIPARRAPSLWRPSRLQGVRSRRTWSDDVCAARARESPL